MTSESLRDQVTTLIAENLSKVIDQKKVRELVANETDETDEGTLDNPADTAVGNYAPMRRAVLNDAAQRLTATGLFPTVTADPFDPLRLVLSDAITQIGGRYLNEHS